MVRDTEQNTKQAARATQVEKQVEKTAGRAEARRDTPKLPRAIRVGPNKGSKKIGVLTPGVYPIFFHQYRWFISDKPPDFW